MNTQTAMIFPLETTDIPPGEEAEARQPLRAHLVGMIERGDGKQIPECR